MVSVWFKDTIIMLGYETDMGVLSKVYIPVTFT